MHLQTLPQQTANLLNTFDFSVINPIGNFYLSGGTALSLQIGHRESEDLDFFFNEDFDPNKLLEILSQQRKLESVGIEIGTLNTYISGVKLQFLHYPYELLQNGLLWNGLVLSSVLDIACTKLQTIGMRGGKKDFIDLFFILDQYPLDFLIHKLSEKYPQVQYSLPHILKSLTYFEDANEQPMPRMHKDVTWEQVQAKMIQSMRKISM
ncbi:MAG: hypothetical protein UX04_C0006G0069 [Microgenomates group bacterium GW2011_GWF2_45_18]|nr:MAG: hypothetical protein UW18_C0006G0069 [Microgenomates group bacterium GW2011_GWF1_44_10]KKU01534.1 MAG: hypothetical protein UX04_C0006G0069 [Microgenomates group bacterium GW2011_GWF2_45_18]OGJ41417.1 MAG: hypothetical protein A2378_00135 [Candidatus Pacebacteria bacterium RIFOXYB1_FULL_44_10]